MGALPPAIFHDVDFADFFENAAMPMHWIAADGTILHANRAELLFLGYESAEYIGHHIAEFHADRAVIDDMLARLARGETLRDHPARLRAKDGTIRHVLIDSNVRWDNGQFLHTRCLTRDVTEQERAGVRHAAERGVTRALADQATLAQAGPAILRALGEALGCHAGALWTVDRAAGLLGRIATWQREPGAVSDSAARVTLARGAGLAGRAWAAAAPVREPAALAVPIGGGEDVAGVIELHGEVQHPPDTDLDRTLLDVGVQLGQFLERERAERRASFLGSLARSVNAALDLDAILQTVAEGARDLCRSDLSAIALREPETGDMVFRYRAGVRHHQGERLVIEPGRGAGGCVLETGQPFRSENLLLDPRFADDDAYRDIVKIERVVTVMVVPITIGERVEGLLYVDNRVPRLFTDHDEAILRELADHAAIAIRNVRLLAGVQRAREDAETANRTKDEFLATLSHELRTPLNAVLGWAVTLRSARLDPATATRALEAIERNARAQSQLIEDLLDISRIVNGKLRLDVRPMNPVTVVEAALDAVRPAAAVREIALRPSLDPRAGPAWVDPDRLQQVVWNLLTNAIKFTPKGGRVDVWLHQVDAYVEIVVSDTGQGIAPHLLPHVFERFRQADSSSTRSQGGLGIGLALVRHLIELHGGTVAAESAGPGQGATFRARLPLIRDAEEARLPAVRHGPSDAGLPSLAGIRVLVVDDERDALELFDGILAGAGAEVRRAAGVAQAIEVLAAWRPEVIVSDIEMPHEDGYAFIRRIRALAPEAGGTLPAVAITAYGSVVDRIRVLSAGFQMHVPKPVEPAELVAVVATLAASAHR